MKLPQPLLAGHLIRRYKRFFAEIALDDGAIVTAHTPNTGSMLQCAVPGYPVLVSRNDDPKRKLRYTLELIRVNGYWVDTHTQRTNRVVEEGLRNGWVKELSGGKVTPEYRYGDSRLDFLVERGGERILVEVKNVTLTDGANTALFPDAVTLRGQKHLRELQAARQEGYRAVIFFLVQRGEAEAFAPADHIDPEYGRLLREVAAAGVEVLAYRTLVTRRENRLGPSLPVRL
ncbi:MAG TPA: DNA/RNA nuclease SfsA [Geothermobacteraceae bacterium]|nr:DNA/RNA nuclease SfsA [Geothermobacteraceae bacterium]